MFGKRLAKKTEKGTIYFIEEGDRRFGKKKMGKQVIVPQEVEFSQKHGKWGVKGI